MSGRYGVMVQNSVRHTVRAAAVRIEEISSAVIIELTGKPADQRNSDERT